jgi:hypothetical protein
MAMRQTSAGNLAGPASTSSSSPNSSNSNSNSKSNRLRGVMSLEAVEVATAVVNVVEEVDLGCPGASPGPSLYVVSYCFKF